MPSSAFPAGESPAGHAFGTAPVFLAAISTILGAVLFLRFGYAVGHLGTMGALWVIALGHLVTIPTAMAVAEIATNRRVEGGGEYYIISRSFGTAIGGTIGISLYLSQAVSTAFYMIAFAQAFQDLQPWLAAQTGLPADARLVSLPAALLLIFMMLKKGANLGVGILWAVSLILFAALAMFFAGQGNVQDASRLGAPIAGADPFMKVFAIVFPAFTGMTAGVGLSGDLRNPRRSIPLGTLAGTLTGMAVYILMVWKLAASAEPEVLADTERFVMKDIALWPPIVPIGLAAAALSSAIGSILVAPRTLQALARDKVFPSQRLNAALARGAGPSDEPARATLVSGAVALVFIAAGDIDSVSQVISMFFMVTYGALCSVSFLEYFSGNPSYRPSFRSRWYVSLLGAAMCFMTMFQMQPLYALVALGLMFGIYRWLAYTRRGERDVSRILRGVMFQLTRRLQIALQQSRAGTQTGDWRPSFFAITRHSFDRAAHFDLLRWICHRQGFGQFVQYVEGGLSLEREVHAQSFTDRLIRKSEVSRAGIFVEAIVAPSFKNAVSQIVQRPGISGLPNNSVLLEFPRHAPEEVPEIVEAARHLRPFGFNICVLRSSGVRFGYRANIHIWLTREDYENAPLMILLAYIILGHPEWAAAEISIFACYPADQTRSRLDSLNKFVTEGRLPISPKNLTAVPYDDEEGFSRTVQRRSADADLLMLGLTAAEIEGDLAAELGSRPQLNEVLFVYAGQRIAIS